MRWHLATAKHKKLREMMKRAQGADGDQETSQVVMFQWLGTRWARVYVKALKHF